MHAHLHTVTFYHYFLRNIQKVTQYADILSGL